LAVLWMIQGHAFTALLRADAMPSAWARWHERLHGLTAPAFMFGAGLAFGTATYGEYRAHRRLRGPLLRRMRWYAALFVLGYLQQAPGWSPWNALHAQGAELEVASRVGALQLIALSLALCQLAILVLPRVRAHMLFSLTLAALSVLLASPLARAGAAAGGGVFVRAYLEDRGGAHFQPLPWAAFVLFGVATSGLLTRRPVRVRGLLLLGAGSVGAALAYATFQAAARAPDPGWLWRTSVSYFLFRLFGVALLLGALHLGIRTARAKSMSSLFARHSLVAYLVHIALLYGTPWTPALAQRFRHALSLGSALWVTAALLASTIASVYGWAWLLRLRRAWFAPRLRPVRAMSQHPTRSSISETPGDGVAPRSAGGSSHRGVRARTLGVSVDTQPQQRQITRQHP
ncbi:MAG TPA: hypothetical protein VFZ61_28765, partial [Polyangiales bacterium]